ncbi:hypothetical protein [Sphingomonas aerophila]|uniref:hypothetical protein n=1 Tax=Sphingomonas aerophila TaxID=1344948 RepID=UPI001607FAFF|nr:hypothetical protein [Sphingomonas aerophila]
MTEPDVSEPDAEWRPWTGGSCPVPPDSRVTVRRRYGSIVTMRAADLRWWHDQYVEYGADDIVAIRFLPLGRCRSELPDS